MEKSSLSRVNRLTRLEFPGTLTSDETTQMSNAIKVELSREDARIILDVLVEHQKGYSVDFPTERITRIRGFIDKLSKNLYK